MSDAFAIDIDSIVTKQCQMHSGVILAVDQTTVKLIDLEGNTQVINTNDIDSIFTYGHKTNPFSQFNLENDSYQFLKEVYFDINQNSPDLVGWPVKFVEDLVFFYSLQAKIYVLSLDQIGKLRPYHGEKIKLPLEHQPIYLEVADYLEKCRFDQPSESDAVVLRPVRILSDQIKIDQFLDSFVHGQQRLNNFQERTYLYAKPFLFPKRARLSIPLFSQNFGIDPVLPFAYIWSTGKDYHFQSNTGIGSQISENLPYLAPTFLLRSDFKSHFFSGSFEGNMIGLSAGEYPEQVFSIDENEQNIKAYAIESLNYLAVMGADYGAFSVGFGSYFPVHRITFDKQNSRGVLAHNMSPLIRFVYTKRKIRLRLIMAKTDYRYNRNEVDEQLVIDTSFNSPPDSSEFLPALPQKSDTNNIQTNTVKNKTYFAGKEIDPNHPLTDFSFSSRFIRIGADLELSSSIKLFADLVHTRGEYRETYFNVRNHLSFKNTAYCIGIEHAFSHYVNLKFQYQSLIRKNTGTFNAVSIGNTDTISSFGGQFELLF